MGLEPTILSDLDPSLFSLFSSPHPQVFHCLLPQWLTLKDVPSGHLHLRLERLTPRPTAAELEEVRGRLGEERDPGGGSSSLSFQGLCQTPGYQFPPPAPVCPPPGAAGEQSDPDTEECRAGGSPAVRLCGTGSGPAGESCSPHPPLPGPSPSFRCECSLWIWSSQWPLSF